MAFFAQLSVIFVKLSPAGDRITVATDGIFSDILAPRRGNTTTYKYITGWLDFMTRVLALLLAMIFAQMFTTPLVADMGVRLYGNWCGPGIGTSDYPPIDPLDAACMRHDMCYIATGSVACECDVEFMRELRAIRYPNPDIQARGRAMSDALAMMPCDSPAGWSLKQSMMWSDIAADALSGRATPFEVPERWLHLFSTAPY